MTIHRSKGLEFPVVCVADLGRQVLPRAGALVKVGRDGQSLGLRLKRPGYAQRVNVLAYDELKARGARARAAEERRLFYVAMTRAKERLIVSGAARLDAGRRATASRRSAGSEPPSSRTSRPRRGRRGAADAQGELGRRRSSPIWACWSASSEPTVRLRRLSEACNPRRRETFRSRQAESPPGPRSGPPAAARCPASRDALLHRARDLRAVRLPLLRAARARAARPADARARRRRGRRARRPARRPRVRPPPGLSGAERGTLIHQLLASIDLRNPSLRDPMPADVRALLTGLVASSTFARSRGLRDVRREQRFAFPIGETLITGVFDVIARERQDRLLVVDYKSDRLAGADPKRSWPSATSPSARSTRSPR